MNGSRGVGAYVSSILVALSAIPESLAGAGEPFRAFDLEMPGHVGYFLAEDLDEDGLKELIVLHKNPSQSRVAVGSWWMSIFFQSGAGFGASPDRTIPIDPRAAVFDVGDLLPTPGKEISFLGPDGLHAYPPSQDSSSYARPQKILAIPSIFTIHDPSALAHFDFISDLDRDGIEDIMVPQRDGLAIYTKDPDGLLIPSGVIQMGWVSTIHSLSSQRRTVGFGVRMSVATPRFLTQDFNGDQRSDLIAIYSDSLCAFFQKPGGGFDGPPDQVIDLRFDRIATGTQTIREAPEDRDEHTSITKITDLNGDGRIDLLALRISTRKSALRPETEVQVYYGRETEGRNLFPADPDQILKAKGTQILADAVDLDGDGRMDLIVPTIKLGLAQIIRVLISKTLEVEVHIFLMGKDGRYPKKASDKRDFPVQFDFKGQHSQPVYEVVDLNNDGRIDILTSADFEELEGYYGVPKKILRNKPDFRFRVKLPRNGERVTAIQLNPDGRADLVITYEKQDMEEGEDLRNLVRVLLSDGP